MINVDEMYGSVDINHVMCLAVCLTTLVFVPYREKLLVHVVVDPVLGKVLRPHQREVNKQLVLLNVSLIITILLNRRDT